jgi:serine/threonine protein kinase
MENLAGAILDGAPIDWASVASSVGPAEEVLLEQFRLLATLAGHHRLRAGDGRAFSVDGAKPSDFVEDTPVIVDGRYFVERPLGEGGMGRVFLARHLELNKRFAIKLLQPHRRLTRDALARFRVEAHALGRLSHPNIVQVTDFGVDPRAGPYLVMEHIDGISLREDIERRTVLSLDEALPIFRAIASALDHAHETGILHRDLKPANVLLFERAGGCRDAKLVDFGIASLGETLVLVDAPDPAPRHGSTPAPALPNASDSCIVPFASNPVPVRAGVTAPGTVVGTLEYIAPEVFVGAHAAPSADIFAFGTLIYETLVGHRPFGVVSHELLETRFERTPPLPSTRRSSLPRELDDAILAPLARDPLYRPRRASDVVSALADAHHAATVRIWRRRELPRRAALSVLMTGLVLWLHGPLQRLPVIQTIENKLVDLRVTGQPPRPPDPRIVLLAIDEATLAADATSLASRADEVGTMLARVFDAGARTVAIDLLLPDQWGRSEPFSQLILDHAPRLVMASFSDPSGQVRGPEPVHGLVTVALGPERVRQLFAFAHASPDADGVVRSMPVAHRDREGTIVHAFAGRIAGLIGFTPDVTPGDRLWIDYSIGWTNYERVSWKDVPAVLARAPETFRDRVVLVGGEFVGSGDLYNTPSGAAARRGEVSGLQLQALTLNTLLDGRRITTSDPLVVSGCVGVATLLAVMTLLSVRRPGRVVPVLALGGVLSVAFSFLFFGWTRELSPIVAPLVAVAVASGTAVLVRRGLTPHPERSFASEI